MSLSKYIKIPSDKLFLSNRSYSDILFARLCFKIKSNYGKYIINNENIINKIEYKSDKKTYKKRIDNLERGGYVKNYDKEIEICYTNIKYTCRISKDIMLQLIDTNIENIIKVYIILRKFYENNKVSWFSYNRLALQLGYKNINKTTTNKKLKEILNKLVELDLLTYKIEYSKKYKCNRFKILSIRRENEMKDSLAKMTRDIKEITGESVKEIVSIIKEFRDNEYNPSRMEIIQVIKYNNLCKLSNAIGKNNYKSKQDYIKEIIKISTHENELRTFVKKAIEKGLVRTYAQFCETKEGKKSALSKEEVEYYLEQNRKEEK